MRLLVTGASGFIGRRACLYFQELGFTVIAFSRSKYLCPEGIIPLYSTSLDSLCVDELRSLKIDCVVHLAGLAHVPSTKRANSLNRFRNSNTSPTLSLAQLASKAGIKRFIYLSSIKVNGDNSNPNQPFTHVDRPLPSDPYAISKYEAECCLLSLHEQGLIDVVIVRPPLVYGPNCKANFRSLLRLISLQIPLPFKSITYNKRSYIYIDNLLDFLALTVSHDLAPGNVFLVSDCNDLSTYELFRLISYELDLPLRLYPFPPSILNLLLTAFGLRSIYTRLCDSLAIDPSFACTQLDWSPPFTLRESFYNSFNSNS